MRQRIKGHVFDTETAKLVGLFKNGKDTLFVSRSGQYFAHICEYPPERIMLIPLHDAEVIMERNGMQNPFTPKRRR